MANTLLIHGVIVLFIHIIGTTITTTTTDDTLTTTTTTTTIITTTTQFKYLIYTLATLSYVLVLLRDYFIVPCMLLPVIIMNRSVESVQMLQQLRSRFQSKFPETVKYVKIKTVDNVNLDAVVYTHPNHLYDNTPVSERKWLIWMNPNGATYEEFLDFFESYSHAVGFSVVGFNYRGVARSEGKPSTADDLIRDGDAVMTYLLQQGAKSENILIHGHSMGGGVGSVVRSKYPEGPIINDRSFRSLDHTIQALVKQEKALGVLVGGLIGLCVGFVVGGTVMASYWSGVGYAFVGLLVFGAIGFKSVYVFASVLSVLVGLIGWKLDAAGVWHLIHGYKVVIYHHLDGIINYDLASLHSAVVKVDETKENGTTPVTKYLKLNYRHFEKQRPLSNPHQVYHVYPLDTLDAEWRLIVEEAKYALHIKN